MREYQHKYIVRTLLYSPVTIVILFLLVILLLRSIMELNNKRIHVAALRNEAQLAQHDLETQIQQAKEKDTAIKTGRGLEEYVRTTYPVVKAGEGVIVVYDDNKNLVTEVRENMNIWERLLVWGQSFMKR